MNPRWVKSGLFGWALTLIYQTYWGHHKLNIRPAWLKDTLKTPTGPTGRMWWTVPLSPQTEQVEHGPPRFSSTSVQFLQLISCSVAMDDGGAPFPRSWARLVSCRSCATWIDLHQRYTALGHRSLDKWHVTTGVTSRWTTKDIGPSDTAHQAPDEPILEPSCVTHSIVKLRMHFSIYFDLQIEYA